MLGAAAPVLPFLLWSCNSHPLQKPEPDPVGESAQRREIKRAHKVDIVFVVDNSGSMQQEQDNLAANFRFFMQELNIPGADLHIAAVSTDLGGGAGSINAACNRPGGDNGLFCTAVGRDTCAECQINVGAAGGRFLRTLEPNFPPAPGNQGLPNAFTCMARFGTTGCGFEHSIGALRRALTNKDNGGFVRGDDSYLAFILITDEDDCTAPPDSQMFSMVNPGQDTSLRCAIEGHACGGQRNVMANPLTRPLSECAAANDGDGALVPLTQMVNDVLAVKKDEMIIAAGIFGWPIAPATPATTNYDIRAANGGQFGDKTLRPVCESRNGTATPGLRVKKFVESFKNNSIHSICQNDFRSALQAIGEKIRVIIGSPCVDANLVDTTPDPKMDPDCVVVETTPSRGEVLLPRCTDRETNVCWQVQEDTPVCPRYRYKIEIDRKGTDLEEGTLQSVRCLTRP